MSDEQVLFYGEGKSYSRTRSGKFVGDAIGGENRKPLKKGTYAFCSTQQESLGLTNEIEVRYDRFYMCKVGIPWRPNEYDEERELNKIIDKMVKQKIRGAGYTGPIPDYYMRVRKKK